MIGGTLAHVRGGRPGAVFVGRADALDKLAEAYAGRTVAVLIGGEAGIGKSRLVGEFLDSLTEARILVGGCLELGEDAPSYAPFTAALRVLVRHLGVAGIADLLPPAAVGELARLLPEFGSPPAEAEGARGRLFETILALIERLAAARPLVVVIEDVHWADRSTRELLTFLVHNLDAERVLFIVTHRDLPDAHPLRPVLVDLARSDRVVRMALPRFTRDEVAALAAGILGRDPEPDVLDALFARSGGNPLFVEVLLSGDGLHPGLAPELRDLLMVAVEKLPEPAQRVLRVAAVGGTEVGHRLLLEVSDLSEAEFDEALRPAVRERVLVTEEDGYAFRHELIREVVYEGLLPGERVRLHRRYAESLESDSGSLAHHWYAAGDTGRAFVASWQAAKRAEVMAAHAERLRMLDRVLSLWSTVDDPVGLIGAGRDEVLRQAVDAADECGELERGVELADLAVEAADPEWDRIGAAQAYFRRAIARFRLGRPGRGEDLHLAMRLAASGDHGPETADRARLLARLAHQFLLEEDLERVRPLAEQSMLLAERLGDEHARALALGPLATIWVEAGELDAARRAYADIRAISARIGLPTLGVCADVNESHELEGLGQHEDAVRTAAAGLETARASELTRTFGARLAGNLAESLFSLGRWDEALDVIATADAFNPPPAFLAPLLTWRGQILLARGDAEGAAEHVATVKRLLPSKVDSAAEDLFMYAWLEAKICISTANPDGAIAVVEQALDAWGPVRLPPRYTWPLLVLGARAIADQVLLRRVRPAHTFVASLEKVADALPCKSPVERAHRAAFEASISPSASWEAARAAWSATTQPYPLGWALLHSAEEAVSKRDRITATAHVRECVAVAESLGAVPLLRQANALAKRARLALTGTALPAPPADPFGLTPREHDVLRLLAAGESNRRIAEHLYISEKTVGVHVSHILTKLGVSNRGEAAAMTHRLGLFD